MAKTKRRAAGEGSVFPYRKGYRAYFKQADGTRKYVYGKTQKEALEKQRAAIREHEAGRLVKSNALKVADVLYGWLETKKRLKYNTYTMYRSIVRVHLAPKLGGYALQKLTTGDIERFINELDMAPSSIQLVYTVLSMALTFAVKRKLIGVSPCQDIALPREQDDTDDIHALSAEQALRLLAACQGHKLECLITLALATGMRRGELLALHWDDIDLDAGYVQVRRTLVREAGKGYVETPPKTKGSRRRLPLADFAVQALKAHRTAQKAALLKVGVVWQEQGLVFCDETGGYFGEDRVKYAYPRLLKAAGLPAIHFHDLRHSAATLLLAKGAPQQFVQEFLGHSSPTMTGRYLHMLHTLGHEGIAGLDTALGGVHNKAM